MNISRTVAGVAAVAFVGAAAAPLVTEELFGWSRTSAQNAGGFLAAGGAVAMVGGVAASKFLPRGVGINVALIGTAILAGGAMGVG